MHSDQDSSNTQDHSDLLTHQIDTALMLWSAYFKPLLNTAETRIKQDPTLEASASDLVTLWHLKYLAQTLEVNYARIDRRLKALEKRISSPPQKYNGKFSDETTTNQTK